MWYGHGMQMWGFRALWGMHFLWWIFWIALAAVLIVLLVRRQPAQPPPPASSSQPTPLEILERRYAAGDISTQEFEERRAALTRK